jgi:hypothetical protein
MRFAGRAFMRMRVTVIVATRWTVSRLCEFTALEDMDFHAVDSASVNILHV